jgi:hypothetical protein
MNPITAAASIKIVIAGLFHHPVSKAMLKSEPLKRRSSSYPSFREIYECSLLTQPADSESGN